MARVIDVPNNRNSFKPADHSGDLALIIVPRGKSAPVKTSYGEKTFMQCDVYTFENMADVQSGVPKEYFNVGFAQAGLVKTLEGSEGMVLGPWRFTQKDTGKGQPAWLFEALQPTDSGYAEANKFADELDARLSAPVPPVPTF